MAKGSVNKAIMVGNLGRDPEVRYTGAGTAVTNLNLATDESYKDRNTGQMVPKTEWHRIVLFGKIAEVAGQYLAKGSKVYIEGRLQTRKWQDQSGQDRYTTEIVVDIAGKMQMLDTRGGGGGTQPGSQAGGSSPAQGQPNGGGHANNTNQGNQGKSDQDEGLPEPVDDFDDDVPFNRAERATA